MSDTRDLVKSFKFEKVLSSNSLTKTIVFLGTIKDETAIITIEKSHIKVDDDFNFSNFVNEVLEINHNDIYHWFSADLNEKLDSNPSSKLNLIYPATETHIRKFSQQAVHYFVETPEIYKKYVVPYIESMKGDRIKWVYNILFEGKESESVIYHDKDETTGFVLLPDMKWDKINQGSLYLTAIASRKDISSVRDLNASHVEWLKSVQSTIKQKAFENYGVAEDKLRLFVHYHPSYYHFHIHVVNVSHNGLGDGINVGKAILLDDVIGNLDLLSDYYSRKSIAYVIGENHGLWSIFKENGLVE